MVVSLFALAFVIGLAVVAWIAASIWQEPKVAATTLSVSVLAAWLVKTQVDKHEQRAKQEERHIE